MRRRGARGRPADGPDRRCHHGAVAERHCSSGKSIDDERRRGDYYRFTDQIADEQQAHARPQQQQTNNGTDKIAHARAHYIADCSADYITDCADCSTDCIADRISNLRPVQSHARQVQLEFDPFNWSSRRYRALALLLLQGGRLAGQERQLL